MQTEWAPAHCDTLRKLLASSLPYSEVATALNAIFNTSYTRSAVIGRAKRMGLCGGSPAARPKPAAAMVPPHPQRSREDVGWRLKPPSLEAVVEPVELRSADVDPRHLSLADLQAGDCRFPYGGDEENEPITFCGHPRQQNSSYCTAHFRLARRIETAPETATVEPVRRQWRAQHRRPGPEALSATLPRHPCRGNVVSLFNFKLQHGE